MIEFPADQVAELKELLPAGVQCAEEAGITYLFLPRLHLAPTCRPAVVDALLCPMKRDGYETRLYLSEVIAGPKVQNWSTAQILGRSWHTHSWQGVPSTLRLAEMLAAHLRPLR